MNEFLPLISMETYIYPSKGLDRPLGLQEAETPRISRQSAHEGGKAVSPTHRPPLSLGESPRIHFSLRLSLIFRHCQLKIPVTPSGIDTATCRFKAQCLNKMRHRLPFYLSFTFHNSYTEAQFTYILVRVISCSQAATVSACAHRRTYFYKNTALRSNGYLVQVTSRSWTQLLRLHSCLQTSFLPNNDELEIIRSPRASVALPSRVALRFLLSTSLNAYDKAGRARVRIWSQRSRKKQHSQREQNLLTQI
jgi:hypothetical protein